MLWSGTTVFSPTCSIDAQLMYPAAEELPAFRQRTLNGAKVYGPVLQSE